MLDLSACAGCVLHKLCLRIGCWGWSRMVSEHNFNEENELVTFLLQKWNYQISMTNTMVTEVTDSTSLLVCCHVNAHVLQWKRTKARHVSTSELNTCQPQSHTHVNIAVRHVSSSPSYTCMLQRRLKLFHDGDKFVMYVTISNICDEVHKIVNAQ